jgi:acyl carrier protein
MTRREQVKYKVDEVMHDILCVGYNEITDDAVLRDDLGADSLDAVEIVMELEHELDIYIPDDKMHEIYHDASYTVKDVYDAVEELMQ